MKPMIRSMSLILVTVVFLFQMISPAQTLKYKIVKTIPVGGETRWDLLAVDETYNRLFVSHSSSVEVLNISTDSLIDKIKNLEGVHDIAFAPKLNKGFISNGRDSSVTVFNLKTLKISDKILVTGQNPDAILYDPFSNNLFTMNGRADNSTAIDAGSDKVIGTIKLDGKPEFAVSDSKGKVFVNIEDKNEIQEFDPVSLKILNTWVIAPGAGPTGLAIDIKNNRLFSACGNKLMIVLDSKSGKIINSLPIEAHVDACAFDADDNIVFSSNGEGSITIIKENSPDNFIVTGNIITEKGARTMAFDNKTKKIYTDAAVLKEDSTKIFSVLVLDKR